MSEFEQLTVGEVEALGRYNAEWSRGIAHDQEYVQRMVELQRRFNHAVAAGGVVHPLPTEGKERKPPPADKSWIEMEDASTPMWPFLVLLAAIAVAVVAFLVWSVVT